MNGTHGMAGWRWIYICEGAITIGIGFIVALVMPDTYHHSRFLTHRQKYLMAAREAQAAEYNWDDGFSWAEVRKALKDPMVHVCAFAQLVSHPIFGSGTC